MPLYDYDCNSCGAFEVWHKMAETSVPRACPDCSEIATRIFTAPNVSLSSGSLFKKIGSPEPRLVKRQSEPSKPTNQTPRKGSRPWMLGHAAERL
ncbi:MAG: zinc ribbon domain-containing protein [Cyanobacteria bacterium J06598_1]